MTVARRVDGDLPDRVREQLEARAAGWVSRAKRAAIDSPSRDLALDRAGQIIADLNEATANARQARRVR